MDVDSLTNSRKLARWKASVGVSATIKWSVLHFLVRQLRIFPEPATWRVRPRQVLHPIVARLRGSSDMETFDQIFLEEEYSCLRKLDEPSIVLDLGANVGFSSAYFLSIFPRARILAVEPDERNVAMCKLNLSPYGDRAQLLHGAVWSRPATLQVVTGAYGDGREWATQVVEVNGEERSSATVHAWDVGSLIDMTGSSTVDLLKIDIERAEMSVFGESACSWLTRVRNLCIELHGKDCEAVFFAALKDFDYELEHSGELTICRNLRSRKAPRAETAIH